MVFVAKQYGKTFATGKTLEECILSLMEDFPENERKIQVFDPDGKIVKTVYLLQGKFYVY